MLHFKAPGRRLDPDTPDSTWGAFTWYLEVAEDQFTTRQVEVFDNGHVLRYDRFHWCDAFGRLLGLRFSRKSKWREFFPGSEIIEAAEFERVWRAAQRSRSWARQVALSRVGEWGRFRTG